MKVQELFESEANKDVAEKKLENLLNDLASWIEDTISSHEVEFGDMKRSGGTFMFKDEAGELPYLGFGGSFTISNYVVDDMLQPTADGTLIVDFNFDGVPGLFDKLKRVISKFFESQNIHLSWSMSSPWYFKEYGRTTAQFTLAKFDKIPRTKSSTSSGARYNPRAEFNSRPGEIARQRRVATSAYSDSFGGDASNYRR